MRYQIVWTHTHFGEHWRWSRWITVSIWWIFNSSRGQYNLAERKTTRISRMNCLNSPGSIREWNTWFILDLISLFDRSNVSPNLHWLFHLQLWWDRIITFHLETSMFLGGSDRWVLILRRKRFITSQVDIVRNNKHSEAIEEHCILVILFK